MSILNIEHAQNNFNNNIIFTDVSLTLERGLCHALIGPDNEGKTSLLNCICGIHRLAYGKIQLFNGINAHSRLKYIPRLFFVPDELLCFERMTGAMFIDMTMKLRKQTDWICEAEELIEYFDVNPAMQLTYMSEDMNKCIYIISAILSHPDFLILDEPFNFLSELHTELLKDWLTAYVHSGGTVLIVSDSFDSVSDIADTVTVMKNRTIVNSLPVSKIGKFKLITAFGTDIKTIPDEFTIVEHNTRHCKMVYKGEFTHLKELLSDLLCDDLTIEDITFNDILYNTYYWLEDVL